MAAPQPSIEGDWEGTEMRYYDTKLDLPDSEYGYWQLFFEIESDGTGEAEFVREGYYTLDFDLAWETDDDKFDVEITVEDYEVDLSCTLSEDDEELDCRGEGAFGRVKLERF